MSFVSGYAEFADMNITGLVSDHVKTNAVPVFYSKTITVPPGESVIKFVSNGRRIDAPLDPTAIANELDRKSTRLNSSHLVISYAVFCMKKKKIKEHIDR